MPPERRSATAARARSVALEARRGRLEPVVRLVLGGIAARADMGFEELDDLQLAVERLLAEAARRPHQADASRSARGSVRTRVGRCRSAIAEALQGEEPPPGELGLRRILATVVDSFGVENARRRRLVVRLEKRLQNA